MSEPIPGIVGGLMATIESGRKLGHKQQDLIDDLLTVTAGAAHAAGMDPQVAAARLVEVMGIFARVERERRTQS